MRIDAPGGPDLSVGEGHTRLMAVLNVTPDSFFDGGRHLDPEAAVARGLAACESGADLLDIGGESTRPGYRPVPPGEQLRRILPVVERLARATGVPLSVDTTSAEVAREVLAAGAHWINDTSALQDDPEMGEVIARHRCPVVLMHRFIPPRKTQGHLRGRRLVERIAERLRERIAAAQHAGIDARQIVLDPGIGFGTLPADSLAIHAHLEPLRRLGRPLLFGPSRKSFLGVITGRPPEDRLWATAASVACLALGGVDILRVHDVAELRDVVRVADAIRAEARGNAGTAPGRGAAGAVRDRHDAPATRVIEEEGT